MAPAEQMARPAVPPGERPAVLAATIGVGALADGLVLWAFGTSALLPGGTASMLVPIVLAAGGVALLVPSLLRLRGDLDGAVERSIPDLYPFGRPWSHVALLVLIVLGAVAFFQGSFESFTPAHSGGDLGAVPDQRAADALVAAAAAVIWTLAAYTVLLVHRVIRLGRGSEPSGSPDVYGRPPDEPPRPIAELGVPTGGVTPPALPLGFVFLLCLALAVSVSVAIQGAEVSTQPASPGEWAWAQLALPVWVGFVASGVSAVDRGLRRLESRVRSLTGAAAPAFPATRP